jgi:hypothetical protein
MTTEPRDNRRHQPMAEHCAMGIFTGSSLGAKAKVFVIGNQSGRLGPNFFKGEK